MPNPTPKLDEKGLYILLYNTDLPTKFHWALFIAQTPTTGILLHQTRTTPNSTTWKLIIEPEDVTKSEQLLAGLKVGNLEDVSEEWVGRVKECVRGASARVVDGEEFTCRTWLLGGVYELADGGFIGMIPDWGTVKFVEEEAGKLAGMAKGLGVRVVVESERCVG